MSMGLWRSPTCCLWISPGRGIDRPGHGRALSVGGEGGATVYVGPTVGWEFAHRFEIVVGPMFGCTTGSSSVLARGAASVLF